jgi:hypothetical protein
MTGKPLAESSRAPLRLRAYRRRMLGAADKNFASPETNFAAPPEAKFRQFRLTVAY